MLEFELGSVKDPYLAPWFSPAKSGIMDRIARLASSVVKDVEMGFYLCYEDSGQVHFVELALSQLI